MKHNFNQPILSFNAKPVLLGITPERVSMALSKLDDDTRKKVTDALTAAGIVTLTFAEACATALCNQGAPDMKGKVERFRLAERLFAGEADITPEERELIKSAVNKGYEDAVVPARVFELLEGTQSP